MRNIIDSLKKVHTCVKIETKRSGRGYFDILNELTLLRSDKYGIGAEEYYTCGYALLDKKYWSEYIPNREMLAICSRLNPEDNDKWTIYTKLKDYYKRKCVNLETSSSAEILAFIKANPEFFVAKIPLSFGGKGVMKLKSADIVDLDTVLTELKAKGFTMLEEPISQHEEIKRINPYAINTIRFVTIKNQNDEIIFLPTVMRFGFSQKPVDNISSGGGFTLLDEHGVVGLDGFFLQNTSAIQNYDPIMKLHPLTHISPYKMEIPYFQEAKSMVKEMARKVPDYCIAGWDIAITPTGPALVELNEKPGTDINFCYNFIDIYHCKSMGMRSKIEDFLGMSLA